MRPADSLHETLITSFALTSHRDGSISMAGFGSGRQSKIAAAVCKHRRKGEHTICWTLTCGRRLETALACDSETSEKQPDSDCDVW